MLRHTWEINGTVVVSIDLVDHVLQLGLGRVLAKGSHDGAQLLASDLSYRSIYQCCLSTLFCRFASLSPLLVQLFEIGAGGGREGKCVNTGGYSRSAISKE